MGEETSFDEEVVAIDAELSRPQIRLQLLPHFEKQFEAKANPERTRVMRYWYSLAIAVNLAALALDRISGVLDYGLIARLGFVVPAYLIGYFLIDRGPNWLRTVAMVVPTITFVAAISFMSQMAVVPHSDRYVMGAGIVILFTNIAVPLPFAHGLAVSVIALASLVGSAVWYSDLTFQHAAMLIFVSVIFAISVVMRYRAEWDSRQSFLEGLRDEIKSKRLIALTQALSRLAETDPMTGLFNRRHLVGMLQEKWQAARKDGTWLGVLMVDIDRFKDFNDTAGHDEGDRCLNAVACRLDEEVGRSQQYLARYGGEEFMIVTSELEPDQLMGEAERLRRAIEAMEIRHPGLNAESHVTVSIGLAAAIPAAHGSVQDLVIGADKALYAAKAGGRNRVEANSSGIRGGSVRQGSRTVIELAASDGLRAARA